MTSTTVTVRLVPVRRSDFPSQPGKAHESGTPTRLMDMGFPINLCSARDHAPRADDVIGEKAKTKPVCVSDSQMVGNSGNDSVSEHRSSQ